MAVDDTKEANEITSANPLLAGPAPPNTAVLSAYVPIAIATNVVADISAIC